MRAPIAVAMLGAALACGTKKPAPPKRPAAPPPSHSTAPDTVMPGYPAPRDGSLVLVSAGLTPLGSETVARAGRCRSPSVLQVTGETDAGGTLLLINLPDSGPATGGYPIVAVDTAAPGARAARLGIETRTAAFRAQQGTLELDRFGARVAGRFKVIVGRLPEGERVKVAGTFAGLTVDTLSSAYCAGFARPVADSGAPARLP